MTTLLLPLLLVFVFTGLGVVAQSGTTFTIEVGRNGSFFIPDSVNARAGDTVKFRFFFAAHGIVQTSFDNPCQPLPGGFNSGVVVPHDGTFGEWTLQITNTSTIWFYCPVTVPVLHCSTGMVGAINPQGENMVDAFKAAAKGFTGTASTVAPNFTGIGAFATAAPTIITSSAPPSETSSTTNVDFTSKVESTSSSTHVPEAPSSNHTAAIVGGTVAGLVALFATIIVVVIILRRRRPPSSDSQRHGTVETHYFPQPTSPPPSSTVSDRFPGKQSQPQTQTQAQFYPLRAEDNLPSVGYGYRGKESRPSSSSIPGVSMPFHVRNQNSQGNLTPAGGIRPVPSTERVHHHHHHPYAAPGVNADVVDVPDLEMVEGRSDINTLAKEVAALLLRGQSQSQSQSQSQINDLGVGQRGGSAKGSDTPRRNLVVDGPPPDYKSRGHSTNN